MSREWTHVDKTTWGPGPWQTEPDKIQWIDPATDLDCLMVRNRDAGNWCGYVGVAEGHPAFEKHYDSVHDLFGGYDSPDYLDVHGGLTFADVCQEGQPEGRGVCHVPEPGRPAHVWWLGFDCAHSHDLSPGYASRYRGFDTGGVYRDRRYVEHEVARLAAQLAALATAPSPALPAAPDTAAGTRGGTGPGQPRVLDSVPGREGRPQVIAERR